jgi:hypothetical protein
LIDENSLPYKLRVKSYSLMTVSSVTNAVCLGVGASQRAGVG